MLIRKLEDEVCEYAEGVTFKLRHKPFILTKFQEDMDSLLTQFVYCVVGWEGLTNEDGTDFECNDKNKRDMYSNYLGFKLFVFEELNRMQMELEEDIKN